MMSKKILLVISKFPPEYSGPGVRIPRFYKWMQNQNHNYKYDLQVLCNGIEQTKNEEYVYEDKKVRRITAQWSRSFLNLFSFISERYKHSFLYQIEFLKTFLYLMFHTDYKHVDLLHIAGHSGGTAAALLLAKIKDIPVLLELVTANAPYRQKFFYFFKTPNIGNQMVIALTQDMKEKCLHKGLDPKKIWCRPNPILCRRQLSNYKCSDFIII